MPLLAVAVLSCSHIHTCIHTRRFEEPQQLAIYSGDHYSKVTSVLKEKGSKSTTDDDGVDKTYKPGREMMSDDQFSSAKVQRRPPKPSKRLKDVPLWHENDMEEQVSTHVRMLVWALPSCVCLCRTAECEAMLSTTGAV
jgi:hypothetical protein